MSEFKTQGLVPQRLKTSEVLIVYIKNLGMHVVLTRHRAYALQRTNTWITINNMHVFTVIETIPYLSNPSKWIKVSKSNHSHTYKD